MSDIIQNMSDIFFLCSHVGVKNCNTVFIPSLGICPLRRRVSAPPFTSRTPLGP